MTRHDSLRRGAGTLVAAAVVLVLLAPATARADDVTFEFAGEVIGGSAGEKLTGTYTFDLDSPGTGSLFGWMSYPLKSATVRHGSAEFGFTGGTIEFTDTGFLSDDSYRVHSTGTNSTGFELLLTDPKRLAISGLSLSETPPDLDDFPTGNTSTNYIRLDKGGTNGVVKAKITSLTVYAAPVTIEVALDVKPRSSDNPLNPKSRGKVPVAVLGAADLDVRSIDVSSLALSAGGAASAAPVRSKVEDVDGDGVPDLLLHFEMDDLADVLAGEPSSLILTGETDEGVGIVGFDTIRLVPAGKGGKKK